jgi:Tfp pilus assembly protein PilF
VDRLGKYEIVGEIGRGGMGRVYEARDPDLARKVAVKVLHGHHTSLFRDEARALAQLNHPGIVTIHEIGSHEGKPYLVMELLVGRALRELLADPAQRPSTDRLVDICGQVAVAIAEAHARGVLHRDIKPENVVVLASGGVKVIDFGIARRLEEDDLSADAPDASRALRVVTAFARTMPVEITRLIAEQGTVATLGSSTETVFGTPAYMAPEVLGGGRSTPASDIYSLGVLVYECLAGRRPYEAPDLVAVVAMVLDGSEPPPPLDHPLAPVVMAMLARDPGERPTLTEVISALVPRARTPAGRGRSPALAIAGVAAVLGIVASAGLVWRATRDRPAAHTASVPQLAGSVAVAPFETAYKTYGDSPARIGSVLAVVLAHIADIRVIEPTKVDLDASPDGGLGARYLVQGSMREGDDGQVTGELELVNLATGEVERIRAAQPVARNAALVRQLAGEIAARVVPGAALQPQSHDVLARKLFETGKQHLDQQQWAAARPYLEQAVELDASSAGVWDALTSARGWTLAPQELIEEAVTRALALSPAEPRRTILEGGGQFFRHDYDAAVATLEPLATDRRIVGDDAVDLAYYLGEALWHRGDHRRGAELLQRVFDERPQFQPAAVHLMQHALVRRDGARAGVLVGQLGRSRRVYELAIGEYEAVARSGVFPLDLHAQIILRAPDAALEAKLTGRDAAAYAIAKAVAAGDGEAARVQFEAVWSTIANEPPTDRMLHALSSLIDVMISSGLADETRRVLAYLASGTSPRYRHASVRAAALAAPLAGTPLPASAGATARQRALIDAAAAELAGEHKTAAARLREVVADPGENFDFAERIALVRNLRALGDRKGVRAQCSDVLRPPVFRYDFVIARARCR